MDVMIIATKACTHRMSLEKELECLQIPYHVCFVEDCADLVQKFSIRHSPNLIVDDEVVSNNRQKWSCTLFLTSSHNPDLGYGVYLQ